LDKIKELEKERDKFREKVLKWTGKYAQLELEVEKLKEELK
jgi:hypothetical protein